MKTTKELLYDIWEGIKLLFISLFTLIIYWLTLAYDWLKKITRWDGFVTFVGSSVVYLILMMYIISVSTAKTVSMQDRTNKIVYDYSCSIDSLETLRQNDSIMRIEYQKEIESLKAKLIEKTKHKKIIIKKDSIE